MQDQAILNHISSLIAEEHTLLESSPRQELSSTEHERLKTLEVSLDQCWDLLRQRRARREFHQDPDGVESRDASTVAHFQQ